jgi:BASS family bile acid:Na+ symporter
MIARYLILWFLLISALAKWWPSGSFDPFLVVKQGDLAWIICGVMFFIGAMLPRDEVWGVLRRWPAVLGGTTLQYVSMPALAFALGKLWGLEGDYFIGIVMVGCVPGAMASNVLTLNARGNASYSVSLTTLATLVSPLAVPLAMSLTIVEPGPEQKQILVNTSITLLWSVVLPVIAGFAIAQLWRRAGEQLERMGPAVANVAILYVIGVVIAYSRSQLDHLSWNVIAALVCVNLLGYAAGYGGGMAMGLDEPMRRALTIEIGMQNAGLGAALALKLFPDRPAVAIAPALFMFGCMLTGTLLSQIWGARESVG